MNRRRTFFVIALFFAAAVCRADEINPTPAELLGMVLQGSQISYQGELAMVHWSGKQTRMEEAKVYFSPPNRYRWVYLSPEGKETRAVVSDGTSEKMKFSGKKNILKGDAAKSNAKILDQVHEKNLLLTNYRLEALPSERVAGRAVWVLELSPTIEGKPHQKYWIDQETYVVLESKKYIPGETYAVHTRFEDFEPKVELADSLFEVHVSTADKLQNHNIDPDFMSISELRHATGKQVSAPEMLSNGFVFESGDFFQVKGHTVIHLRYTDGLSVLSLFETERPVELAGDGTFDAPFAVPQSGEFGGVAKVLHWRHGPRYYTLMGSLSRPLLERLAMDFK